MNLRQNSVCSEPTIYPCHEEFTWACFWHTAKPTGRQKSLTILADSLTLQSVSRQFEFLWKSTELHQPGSTGQCRLTAIVANAIFIRLDKWYISLSLCISGHFWHFPGLCAVSCPTNISPSWTLQYVLSWIYKMNWSDQFNSLVLIAPLAIHQTSPTPL